MIRFFFALTRLIRFFFPKRKDEPTDEPSPLRASGKLTGRRNVVGYTLRSDRDRILYIGITNHPIAREDEHLRDGKRFSHLNVETKPMSREYARQWETRRLESYREFTGHNPLYNYTLDGDYEPED